MRFDLYDGTKSVGSVVWEGPGQIRLDVTEPAERRFLADYFSGEVTYLSGGFDTDDDEFQTRRRDWSPWEFERAARALKRVRDFRVVATPVGPIEEASA